MHDHPDVDDVCVIGIVDEYSGELPLAFVVLSTTAQNQLKSQTTTQEELRSRIMKVGDTHKFSTI